MQLLEKDALKAEINRISQLNDAQKNIELVAAWSMNRELGKQLGLQLAINRMIFLAMWGKRVSENWVVLILFGIGVLIAVFAN